MTGSKVVVGLFTFTITLILACANPALTHVDLGDEYTKQSQWEQAIAEYTRAIELDPKLAVAYNNRAYAYWSLGRRTQAIADLEMVMKISADPDLTRLARELLRRLRQGW